MRVAGIVVAILVSLTGAVRSVATALPDGCDATPLEGVVFGFDFVGSDAVATRYTEEAESYCDDVARRDLFRGGSVGLLGALAAVAIHRYARRDEPEAAEA